ncbi:hypothetical protein OKW45_007484 [Paraburkholderia sp. WSM4175]|uniref:hypothetical protein n=1 Tax=Paraburkholderia sp. WSM4175 TaxID=2991072 RepID=UPI003D193DCB
MIRIAKTVSSDTARLCHFRPTSAGYGIWLARSGFAGQSLRTLFGRAHGIDTPRIYMMQPFDPNRRIILMLLGLASSPEAWVNVANDIQGDEVLRQHFQVWQVYYPTNVPILVNLAHPPRHATDARAFRSRRYSAGVAWHGVDWS